MTPSISILLADDHEVVRKGLRALIEAEAGLRVIGEAADGLEVLEAVERLAPDVLVVDVMMPGLDGLEALRRLRKRGPKTRAVVLSMHSSEGFVIEALRSGALGYVLKGATATDLVRAIREAAAGRRYLSPPLSDQAIEVYSRQVEMPADPYQELTPREREVLHLSAEGRTSRQIAERLGISARTADTHRNNLKRKLHVRTHAELVRYGVARGLLSTGEAQPLPGSRRPRRR